jgi:hypothetical protein
MGQYKAYEATEERIDKEEPETIREPTRLMDTRIEESQGKNKTESKNLFASFKQVVN